jgi:DNA replication and repair protein RecF
MTDLDDAVMEAMRAPQGAGGAPPAARLRRLSLRRFRSYASAKAVIDRAVVVLVGQNGAGKTNVIEAVSLFAAGRGLRRARLEDLPMAGGDGSFAVVAEIDGALGPATLGTGVEGQGDPGRKYRINGEPVRSAAAFADHLRVVWLVPAMDGLFAGPPAERRRFLDRLVLAVDPAHAGRVGALDRALRSRNRLLEARHPDAYWLDAVERETAELAVAVAGARAETVRRLSAVLAERRDPASAFPWAEIALDGAIEKAIGQEPATDIEDRYRAALKSARGRDGAAGRTLEGPHRTDLVVTHGPKRMPAGETSTGEQKALLLNLVLAHAGLVTAMTGLAPVLLLDEVAAHLDPARRAALFDALVGLRLQVLMTGADPEAFAKIAPQAAVFAVQPGELTRSS